MCKEIRRYVSSEPHLMQLAVLHVLVDLLWRSTGNPFTLENLSKSSRLKQFLHTLTNSPDVNAKKILSG